MPIAPDLSSRPVFLIGGGPSAGRLGFKNMRDRGTVIAINDALKSLPWADIVFSADGSWAMRRIGPVSKFKGLVALALDPSTKVRFAQPFLRMKRVDGAAMATSPEEIPYGDNSGFGALNFAVACGAKRIALAGYDMNADGHWHAGYEWKTVAEKEPDRVSRWIKAFETVAPALKAAGVDVVNLNPESALRCFRFQTLGGFLEGH